MAPDTEQAVTVRRIAQQSRPGHGHFRHLHGCPWRGRTHERSCRRPRTDLDIDVSTLIDGHDLKVQLSGGPAYLPMHHLWEGVVQVQVQAAF